MPGAAPDASAEATPGAPRVAVVVVNWNRTELTRACLRSLSALDWPPQHVVVVDNGSPPASLPPIKAEFPQTTLLRNERNLGFAAGSNIGMRQALAAGVDYIMLLNNDAEVAPDLLRTLVDFASSDPQIGIVGPLICYYDDPERIWFAGGVIEPGSGRALSPDAASVGSPSEPRQVDWFSGCALVIKRQVIDAIGLLDERMFAYYEDVDWCVRAIEAGYQVWLVPQARVWHKIEMQERLLSPWYVYLMTRNRLLFERNRGAPGWRLLWRAVSQDLWQALNWLYRRRYRHLRPLAVYKIRAVADFMLGRFGEPRFPA